MNNDGIFHHAFKMLTGFSYLYSLFISIIDEREHINI